jgi:hypothetical protein
MNVSGNGFFRILSYIYDLFRYNTVNTIRAVFIKNEILFETSITKSDLAIPYTIQSPRPTNNISCITIETLPAFFSRNILISCGSNDNAVQALAHTPIKVVVFISYTAVFTVIVLLIVWIVKV